MKTCACMLALGLLTVGGPLPAAETAPSAIVARNIAVVAKSYPKTSLKRGEEGIVRFRINVTREGFLEGCQVTKSSGYEALDKATCDMLLAGATAEPLKREDGWKTPGVREGFAPWVLPAGTKRPATPPPYTANVNAEGEPLVCRTQLRAGSLYIREKICLTAKDWQRQHSYAEEEAREMQRPKGPMNGI